MSDELKCPNCGRDTGSRGCVAGWLHLRTNPATGEQEIDHAFTAQKQAECDRIALVRMRERAHIAERKLLQVQRWVDKVLERYADAQTDYFALGGKAAALEVLEILTQAAPRRPGTGIYGTHHAGCACHEARRTADCQAAVDAVTRTLDEVEGLLAKEQRKVERVKQYVDGLAGVRQPNIVMVRETLTAILEDRP